MVTYCMFKIHQHIIRSIDQPQLNKSIIEVLSNVIKKKFNGRYKVATKQNYRV